jgi:hypothetical protein
MMDEASLTKILSGAVSVARLQDYQKSVNELIEFLSRNALRTAHLDRANPKASWLGFFNTRGKWEGGNLRKNLSCGCRWTARSSSFPSSYRRARRTAAAETA